MHILAHLITSKTFLTLVGVDVLLLASEVVEKPPAGVSDFAGLVIDQGVQVAIVVMFIVGQWTNRIVFVNKDKTTQLDRIETQVAHLVSRDKG